MTIDVEAIEAAILKYGPVARVTVAVVAGSAPREVGASMLVWQDGQSGTIGGGTLEFDAASAARRRLANATSGPVLDKIPLGPTLGQCCGGTVTLLTEVISRPDCENIRQQIDKYSVFARPASMNVTIDPSMAVSRIRSAARSTGQPATPALIDGWFVEPARKINAPLWIFGAGHVGRALVNVFQTLPYDITWIDTAADRFPADIPNTITRLYAENPAALVSYAPKNASHLVLTYSHALDLEICHRLLGHGFETAGLIGSKTKWTRFRKRLDALGHTGMQIAQIACPIGRPDLGKSPEAIAIGVAAELLLNTANQSYQTETTRKDAASDHAS